MNIKSDESIEETNIINVKHNAEQLEFPFVKDIDAAYIAARYNLNAEEED